MKAKKLLSAILAGAMVLSTMTFTAFADNSTITNWTDEGNYDTSWYNDTDTEFTISDAEDLAGLSVLVNGGNKFEGKKITLGANIDLEGKEWSPIGGESVYFAGELDGNTYTISNMTNTQDVKYKGLFGLVEKCYIHDLTLADVSFSGNANKARIGALAGNLQYYNVIKNVVVEDLNYNLSDNEGGLIGGLVGYAWESYVKDCRVDGATINISSTNDTYVGGMISYGRGVGPALSDFPYSAYISAEDSTDDGSIANYVGCVVDNATVNLNGTVSFGGFIGGDTYNSWRNVSKNCSVENLAVTCAADDGVYTVGGYMSGQYGGLRDSFIGCSAQGTITSSGTNTASNFGGFLGYVCGRSSVITNASADVDISVAAGNVGGFVSEVQVYNYADQHKNEYSFDACVAEGNVETKNGTAGGFASGVVVAEGNGDINLVVSNSTADGAVTGTVAGGFIGSVNDTSSYGGSGSIGGEIKIADCEATKKEVVGTSVVSGLVGSVVGEATIEPENVTTTPVEELKTVDTDGNIVAAPSTMISSYITVNGVSYATLDDAIAVAKDTTNEIVVKSDLIITKQINENVTINMNGNKIVVEKNSTLVGKDKTVTLKNAVVDFAANAYPVVQLDGVLVLDATTATIADKSKDAIYINNDGGIVLDNGAVLNIKNITGNAIIHENNGAGTGADKVEVLNGSSINIENVTGNGIKNFNNMTVSASTIDIDGANGNSAINATNLTIDNSVVDVDGAGYYGISTTNATVKGTSTVTIANVKNYDGIYVGNGTMSIEDTSSVDVTSSGRYDLNLKDTGTIVVKNNAALNASKTNSADAINRITAEGNATVKLMTPSISVKLEKTEDERVYDIVLAAADAQEINRLTAADLTFDFDGTTDNRTAMSYEIVKVDNIEVNNVNNSNNRYEFHFNGEGAADATDAKIVIAQVKFNGYGTFTFKVANADTNAVQATEYSDSIVKSYIVGGDIAEGNGELIIDGGTATDTIKVPTHELTINIDFPNEVDENDWAYQDMTVTISGGDLKADETINSEYGIKKFALGTDEETTVVGAKAVAMTDGDYVITQELTENTTYTVTVEGAGYRTAKYTVTMTEDKTLNFWNNVKDAAFNVEELDDTSAKNVTFLAGDIVKDSNINIYDLSAVVSYFGEVDLSKDNNKDYAKYDLNRDGKINSKDVAYVLVSWGK